MIVLMLDRIVQHKRAELARRTVSPTTDQPVHKLPPVRSLAAVLRAADDISLIAEIKRRSPSRGVLAENLSAKATARQYEQAGAQAISVLTESHFFGGADADLQNVRQQAALPVLRKDFIIDKSQIDESRRIGADAILLIAAILSPIQLQQLYTAARNAGLEVLLEVHTAEEIEIALAVGAEIIGINNRDLKTFNVDLHTSAQLRPLIPDSVLCVSESGITNRDDMRLLADCGFAAALVGEAIVTSADRGQKIRELLGSNDYQD